MNTEEPYRVVVFSQPEDPADLRSLLMDRLGLNSIDAGIAAHQAPGILPQKLDWSTGENVVEAITRLGLRSAVVKQDDLLQTKEAQMLHHVQCSESGFQVFDMSSQLVETIPWTDLKLLCTGRVPLDITRHFRVDNVLHAGPIPPDGNVDGSMHGCEAWLVFENPRRVIHIDSNHMNYEYLGTRKSTSGTANFRLLLEDIVKNASGAFLSPATRACLANEGVDKYDYDSTDELQQTVAVQYLLVREISKESNT